MDLRALGLSATDYLGHAFGHGGEEMRDNVLRLDQRLGAFLAKVRSRVPHAWFVLTADHGASDAVERLGEQHVKGRRLHAQKFLESILRDLEAWKVGASALVYPHNPMMLYLREGALQDLKLDRATALQAIRKVLLARPEVAEVATAEELAGWKETRQDPAALSVKGRLALSFTPGRSGDLLIAYQPFTSFSALPSLTDHGSPWDYDRRVPLAFVGPWKAERRDEPVSIVDLAPTLAHALGIRPSETLDGRILELPKK